ncbi:MAG TPA: dTDP-4-dehydrorhamnose reductase [Burkholderiales bacterium]|jgi:dTDP-4-dehydrorhamnose reductase|nr:dTDP-4-dehydrorhamnose reductase [Burkholderiales bacterium]
MRILILGRDGQLGRALAALDWGSAQVESAGRAQADLATPAAANLVLRLRPDAVINAAAWTDVEGAESARDAAFRVNAQAPGELARACAQVGAWLVHYSTDYVFDGAKPGAYGEGDAPHPINIYGASKLAGEAAIAQAGGAHLILRTSWVYSADGDNFLTRVIARARAAGSAPLPVVDDQVGAPTWTLTLAEATRMALRRCVDGAGGRELSGLYHLTPGGRCSWFEYARAAFDLLGIEREIAPVSAAAFAARARRPANSALDASRFATVFGWARPHWRDELRRCLASPPQSR